MLDCFSRYAWGRLYTSKLPLTAVQVMHNDVLPFFDEHRVRVKTVLSDNGREFCGRPDRHPYELFLQLEDIEHLRVKGRTTWYETLEEMQTDLEAYLETYNRKRPHRGRAMEGSYAVSGLQGRSAGRRKGRKGQEGGAEDEGSLDTAPARANCQVITISVHTIVGNLPVFGSQIVPACL